MISATVLAQQTGTNTSAGISPIPLFPADGAVPEGLRKNHVFLDPGNSALVIAYSENGDAITKRVRLGCDVDPFFHVSVRRDDRGDTLYEYTLRNGERARQRITSWTFNLPLGTALGEANQTAETPGRASLLKSPPGWNASETIDPEGRHHLQWSTESQVGGIPPEMWWPDSLLKAS
ncbi:MAG: hypothetical protein JO033_27655 [Acidobacteriaceae bacterium]|nr:hypothetical protein [Acidobacteriaceae bacterium]